MVYVFHIKHPLPGQGDAKSLKALAFRALRLSTALLVWAGIAGLTTLAAQSTESASQAIPAISNSEPSLPPAERFNKTFAPRAHELQDLDSLIIWALNASPEIKQARFLIEKREVALQSQRLSMSRYISTAAGIDYGNGRFLSLQNDGTNPTNVYLDRKTSTYQVGLTLRIPLNEFVDRKNSLRTKTLEIADAQMGELITELQVKEEVIERYQRVVTALNLLEQQAAAYQANELAMIAAEEQFRIGKIAVDQYAVALQMGHLANIDLEKAKGEARMAISLLEVFVGTSVFKS